MASKSTCGTRRASARALQSHEAPVNDAPVNDAPVNDAPVNDAPVNDAPVNDAPTQTTTPPLEATIAMGGPFSATAAAHGISGRAKTASEDAYDAAWALQPPHVKYLVGVQVGGDTRRIIVGAYSSLDRAQTAAGQAPRLLAGAAGADIQMIQENEPIGSATKVVCTWSAAQDGWRYAEAEGAPVVWQP